MSTVSNSEFIVCISGTHAAYAEAGAEGAGDQYGALAEPPLLPSL